MVKISITKFIIGLLAALSAGALVFIPSSGPTQASTNQTTSFTKSDTPVKNTSAPFDGGLSLLVAAGIGYASKKRYDKRKHSKSQETIA